METHTASRSVVKKVVRGMSVLKSTGAVTLENSMTLPQMLNIKLSYDPTIAQLGIYPGIQK